MIKTQLILLRSCLGELEHAVRLRGPIVCNNEPASKVVLSQPPTIAPEAGRVPLSKSTIREIERTLALSCTYDSDDTNDLAVRHRLQIAAIALQLVRPTFSFLELWLQLDANHTTEMVDRTVSDLGRELGGPVPYLQYQQHHCISESDVTRALAFLPRLAKALDSEHGSWDHPFLSIHRALIFFCQGYSDTLTDRQFLWAAGLDCLYASKLEKNKQGSREIGRRLQQLLGATVKLYEADTVSLPIHQKTRSLKELKDVTADIFKLRNAFAHGLRIPDTSWLAGEPYESGYAYQLLEQTEIALRLTLLRILESDFFFETFADPQRLDAFFP